MTTLHHLQHMRLQQAARAFAMREGGFNNAIADAQSRASKLLHRELKAITEPMRHAVNQARKGLLVERQWLVLCSALNVGQAIEAGGVVRGLIPQLDAAHDALQAINDRATANETRPWKQPTLYAAEIDAINTLVTVHIYQLKQVSYGEYQEAWRLATARVKSAGGRVVAGEPIVIGT